MPRRVKGTLQVPPLYLSIGILGFDTALPLLNQTLWVNKEVLKREREGVYLWIKLENLRNLKVLSRDEDLLNSNSKRAGR